MPPRQQTRVPTTVVPSYVCGGADDVLDERVAWLRVEYWLAWSVRTQQQVRRRGSDFLYFQAIVNLILLYYYYYYYLEEEEEEEKEEDWCWWCRRRKRSKCKRRWGNKTVKSHQYQNVPRLRISLRHRSHPALAQRVQCCSSAYH